MNEHYVCTGDCGGMSGQPGVCQAETCAKKGQPLTPCTCENGAHAEAKAKAQEETGH